MCRWIAYSGSPIYLEQVVVKPTHSLLRQSRFAEENFVTGIASIPDGAFPTNDDGFGFAWYGERKFPGVFKDIRPAWNDRNYLSIAAQTKSHLFFAHIRAAYQGVVQRTNCHPFMHHNWLFQHNGEISEFALMKRDILLELQHDLVAALLGTTDTEAFFMLLISYGLFKNPKQAFLKATDFIEELRIKYNIKAPFRLTASATDGKKIYAVRYSSHAENKSLYINSNEFALVDDNNDSILPKNGKLLASEPLSLNRENWQIIPDYSFVTIDEKQQVIVEDFKR